MIACEPGCVKYILPLPNPPRLRDNLLLSDDPDPIFLRILNPPPDPRSSVFIRGKVFLFTI